LRGLKISEGSLNTRFSSYTAFYTASVDENVSSIDITPTTLENDYKTLTVNGIATVSGNACKVNLTKGANRVPIVVTASDNTDRAYTLTITRGN
jgi:ribosomal protein S4E